MCEISVIIPVFNAEKYLKHLLDSLIHQTFGFEKMEMIMIDDCSTDKSKEVMERYAKKYKNIKAIYLKENHHVAGTARNVGMKEATGKYYMFADADDFFTENACKMMYDAIEEKNADFITANYINTDENGTLWNKPIFDQEKYKDFKLSIKDFKKSFFILNSSACNKIFRASFVKEKKIQFLEGVPAEDAFFTTSCFIQSKKVYYLKEVMYCYRQRNKDKKTNSVSFSLSRDYFRRINIAYRAIYENFRDHKQIAFYRYTYAKNMSYMLYKFIDSKALTDEERIDVMKEMRWFYELSEKLRVPACQMAQSMIVNKIIKEDYEEALNYCKIVADIRNFLPKEIREDMSRPDAAMYQKIEKYNEEYEEEN